MGRRPTIAAFSIALGLLTGCGSADETRTARDEPTDDPGLIGFEPGFNLCPHFEASLILPRVLAQGQAATIAVRATDPDGDDDLIKYSWSAGSGEFTEPLKPTTEYRCSESGDQLLTVVASDLRECDTRLQLNISCVFQ